LEDKKAVLKLIVTRLRLIILDLGKGMKPLPIQ
jgi:hypothetical protein